MSSGEHPPHATFEKRRGDVPADFFAVEAAGLSWLQVPGGVPVVTARTVTATSITLDRIAGTAPSASAAREFGRRLAVTHASAGAEFGTTPPGARGSGYIADLPLPSASEAHWGPFYAEFRLGPYLRLARDAGTLDTTECRTVEALMERLTEGDLGGPDETPSRIHGDLWSGNVLWSAEGAVLIDPAAHGGHRETDLAMLTLFGLPYLDDVLAGYQDRAPLAPGWRDRIALHQLHPLLVHTVLFGRSYARQLLEAVARY